MTSAADQIGVGVIGMGDVSAVYLRNLLSFKGVKLVACASRRLDAARVAPGIESLAIDALLKSDDIGIVVNLTPPLAHAEVTRAALSAGKHVYSEKPLAVSAAEGRNLLAEAESRGLMLGCAPDTFLGAGGRLSRALIDENHIGRVLCGVCAFMSRGMEHRHPNPEFFFKIGGGPVLDLGPYYLTALINLLGPVKSVLARTSKGLTERIVSAAGPNHGQRINVEAPTTAMAIVSFHSGAEVTVILSWDVWRHGHSPIELYGSEGSLKAPDPDEFGGEVLVSRRGGEWERLICEDMALGRPNWRHAYASPSRPLIANYRGVGVAEMADALLNGAPHRSSGALAAHALEVMEAIERSSAEERAILIDSVIARPAAMTEVQARALLLADSPIQE